jgi:hypothetical protein
MLWVVLARFIMKRPPWLQSVIFGLCAGLFVTAAAEADQRNPLISTTVLMVLVIAVVVGVGFYLSLRAQMRHGWTTDATPPTWVNLAYPAAWLLSVLAAIAALLGAGGFKVAVLAIVPIVLLAPPALIGIRTLVRRRPGHQAEEEPQPGRGQAEPGLSKNRQSG